MIRIAVVFVSGFTCGSVFIGTLLLFGGRIMEHLCDPEFDALMARIEEEEPR